MKPLPILAVAIPLLFSASACPATPPPWPRDAYLRQLVEEVLPETSPKWDGQKFALRGSRSATYIAAGLLWRDGPHDRASAAAMLRGVLELQYQDGPESKLHGLWCTRQNETESDANWREFIGCGLILILETFPERLPVDLVADMRAAILKAADGSARRNVGASYTNIALMSALLLDYVGAKENRPALQKAGLAKAEAIHDLFARHKTFNEYNSPTYYGPDLMALALWREHACSPRLCELGRSMEADLWRDIAAFYHAGLRNMCGPYVRAYGMDMTQYCALTGLWIAMAIGDPRLAPWPGPRGRHGSEAAYGPVFALLRPSVPDDVLPHLRSFAGPRSFERTFGKTRATALVEKDWMMGAAALDRQWDQHHPATIHWLVAPGRPVGWILLSGTNKALSPVVANGCLRITRTSKSDEPIQFFVGGPDFSVNSVEQERWNLPNFHITLELAEGVKLAQVKAIDHARYGRCLEVLYRVPPGINGMSPAIILQPRR